MIEPPVPRLPVPPGADARWQTSDRIGHQLIRLMRVIERRHAGKIGPDGVERAAYVLLARLVLDGPRRSNALAEAVHSDPSTVSRQVAALVRHGLVERRSDPDDGRASLLAATDEGLRVFEANRDRRNTDISALTVAWSEDDRETLAELLSRFTTDLEAARPPDGPRLRDHHDGGHPDGGHHDGDDRAEGIPPHPRTTPEHALADAGGEEDR